MVISEGLLVCYDSAVSLEDSCLSVSSVLCREIWEEIKHFAFLFLVILLGHRTDR